MKISFVLPVYNAQSTLAVCIQSLLKQTHDDFEIIIINDGSVDNTERILNSFKDKKLKIINRRQPRSGAAVCRNIGNKMVTGQIIAVCDAEIYDKRRGEAIDSFFIQNKDKSVFYSALYLKDSKNIYEPTLMEAYEWDFNSKCPISHPTVAYREVVARECPYHEIISETDLYEFMLLDAHRKGYLFGGCQDPLAIKIEGNSVRNKKEAKLIKQKMYKQYGINVVL